MRGITEERLEELYSKASSAEDKSFLETLIFQCTELNHWQPIETAPKDRRILLFYPDYVISSGCYNDYKSFTYQPTHWQELPEDPK